MKTYYAYLSLILLFISCGGGDDDSITEPINKSPGIFTVEVENLKNTEATLKWTESVDPDNDIVSYKIQQGSTSIDNISETIYTFKNLNQNTNYKGSITALDGNGGEITVAYDYTTLNESSGNTGTFSIPADLQDYYKNVDFTKTENELFLALSNTVISTHVGIPYTSSSTDVWDACKLADEDPDVSSNVLLIYGFNDTDGVSSTDRTRSKSDQDVGGGDTGKWNREHVFAKSLANPNLGTDEPSPGTDVHNLRPADSQRNSTRGNKKFSEGSGNSGTLSNGGWYPGDEWKGDVARIVMYMYIRYNGNGSKISETNCFPINVGIGNQVANDSKMIDLFLKWNIEDPVSEFEADRNDALAGIQKNRNPFIDNPYLATVIWGGDNASNLWEN